ncbi:unannotated protein [freshwater metagenome]|uniref:Unannotated protein n=1 Tax=freshwater metagenome TaxID=449393 RepID=A0A6J7IM10_9ZZZZ
MVPFCVRVVPIVMSNVPPPAFKVVARDIVMSAVARRMPPPNVRVPAPAPRLASRTIEIMPALIVVPPP